jgi:hypothetical protein
MKNGLSALGRLCPIGAYAQTASNPCPSTTHATMANASGTPLVPMLRDINFIRMNGRSGT